MLNLLRPQIAEMIDLGAAMTAVEDAYRAMADGRANLSPVGYMALHEHNGDCHIKYGHIRGDAVFVIKVATGFYDNQARGLPNGNGISIAVCAKTGAIKAVLHDAGLMTDVRTGLGGAIATRALCRPDSARVVIVGTGVQARYQARALTQALGDRPLVFSVWGRSSAKAETVVADLEADGIVATAHDDLEVMCRCADVVITTTPSRVPLIEAGWIRPGTHITAVGADAPGKQELSLELVERADVLVADSVAQCLDHGEFSHAAAAGLIDAQSILELGSVLAGSTPGRLSDDAITIADLTGLAVQDVAIARVVLEEAHRAPKRKDQMNTA